MNNKEDRINLILKNKDYIKYQKENDSYEIDRRFCRHNIQHSLDVARIAYILNLEGSYGYKKDIVYAAALLHDIGKWRQYKDGILHSLTGAELAEAILKDCLYNNVDVELITNAILKHSNIVEESKSLDYLLFFADKKSRNCFVCHSVQQCKWSDEKKNHNIIF